MEKNQNGGPRLRVSNLRSAHAGPFSLDMRSGECMAITGPSGSGKTIFLRMLADLDPNQGDVSLDGKAREEWSAPQWRRSVMYQAAEPAWWQPRVSEHFLCSDRQRVCAMLPRLGLDAAMLEMEVERLSTGERQRLALVRSLVRQPAVLLLDEPTAALDRDAVAATEALLREQMHAGLMLVLVTHSAEQAAQLGHRRMEIRNGKFTPP